MLCINSDVDEGLSHGRFYFWKCLGLAPRVEEADSGLSGLLFPGRQAGCGPERKWEFFDFEISREERQTFWECLCDGGPR